MEFLFDTHLLLWIIEGSDKLPNKVKDILENSKNEDGEIQVASTPKRRVSSETETSKPARRATPEYKVISDN